MKKILSIVTFVILIFSGVLMSGCGQDYSSLSLSFDLNNSSKIELSVGDEAKEYFVKIENYYEFDPVFTFSFAEDVATVKSYQKATNDGVYKFSITPLRPGETTLSLDLSGLNKPLKIPVRVTNDIVGFAPTNQIYATRGNTLQLNSSLFTFTPPDTSQTGLNFDLKTVFDGLTLDSNTNTLTVPANYTAAEMEKILLALYDVNEGAVRFGGKVSRGFGKMRIENFSMKVNNGFDGSLMPKNEIVFNSIETAIDHFRKAE